MKLDQRLNTIPSPTFGRLRLNGDVLQDEIVALTTTKTPLPGELPDGVTLRADVSYEDAMNVFREAVGRLTARDHDYSAPNGERFDYGDRQMLPTGIGPEMDALLQRMEIPVSVLEIGEGAHIAQPVLLHHALRDGDASLCAQVIHARKGSEVTVICDYRSGTLAGGFCGASTKVLAEEGAKVHLVRVQLLGERFLHLDDIGAITEEDAAVDLIQMELGGSKAYAGTQVHLSGDRSCCTVDGGYLTRKEQLLDLNYVTRILGKKAECYMHFKGVMMDRAVKTLRGSIDFKNGCKGAYGEETEDVLLLSEDVTNRSIPLILCQEDDINGEHGATIGRLSDEELFYIESRGIAREDAERMIVRARLKSIARKMPPCALREETISYINRVMKYESTFNDCDDLILCEGREECEDLCN